MKRSRIVVSAALALCAAQVFAGNHTVTFRRMNGTVLQKIELSPIVVLVLCFWA